MDILRTPAVVHDRTTFDLHILLKASLYIRNDPFDLHILLKASLYIRNNMHCRVNPLSHTCPCTCTRHKKIKDLEHNPKCPMYVT